MTNFDKPVPVPGVFSLQDFQNLASFSGAGEDNGFNVQSMFNNRNVDPGFSPFDPSNTNNQESATSPNYGFSSKSISNVGGVTAQNKKQKNEAYIPEVETPTLTGQETAELMKKADEDLNWFQKLMT